MQSLGYSEVKHRLDLIGFNFPRPAVVANVVRVTNTDKEILIPKSVVPKEDTVISHILFAIKYQGIDLALLAQALRKISEKEILEVLVQAPSGMYIRKVCYLWEAFNQKELQPIPKIEGAYVDLFDENTYVTGVKHRNSKWRVNFNGLGSLDYCVSVTKTPKLVKLLEDNILEKVNSFIKSLDACAIDRAMNWAYLSETESSFEIEREKPSHKKSQAFIDLLKQVNQAKDLSEEYFVQLQNITITNPLDQAFFYRHQQNWLSNSSRGAIGVTYIPPPPEMVSPLMEGLLKLINLHGKEINPLIVASIASFGLVFIHPFMDGNGRLSRFLFHYVLSLSKQLDNGLMLPISIAIQRHEKEYLKALQSFSIPARDRWEVLWIDQDQYQMKFLSDMTMYQFWDATECVEFGLEMAMEALEVDLKKEVQFLETFDAIYKKINHEFDVRNTTLNYLILGCLQNLGKISNNRRKKFANLVQEELYDAIESAYAQFTSKTH